MTTTASAEDRFVAMRRCYWDSVANESGAHVLGKPYHRRLVDIYRFLIPPNQRVLEVGSGKGDLLASVAPSRGVGIDLSPRMIEQARQLHPEHAFMEMDAMHLELQDTFDYVIMSDLLNDLWDVQAVLERLSSVTNNRSRIVLNSYSRVWELPLRLASRLGMAKIGLPQNWLAPDDIHNLLRLSGFEVIRSWEEVLWPIRTPLLDTFFNRFLVKLPVFRWFALTNFVLARPMPSLSAKKDASVSVVVPARNEAGNIERVFQEIPRFGREMELVFVEGNSSDRTYEVIKDAIAAHPEWKCSLLKQTGKGKGDAVRLAFEKATGDVLVILDADLTVPAADLTRFYDALVSGKGEFINGVRLVYPMEGKAMRFCNLIGNKFFSIAFSWLLGQPVKDTLCGTKMLSKVDYESIAANRSYFGEFDPFGDFDLIFGAAKQGMKIVDMPVRYRDRTYGAPNISRWRDGLLLLRMVSFAARRLKFR